MVTHTILPLKITNASVRIRGNSIIEDVSLEISPVGFTFIMGPNGAGKTTLLRLMCHLERPANGSVDYSVSKVEANLSQSFVFQTPVLMRRTVLDNIAYPLLLRGNDKKEANERAAYWADKVGIGDRQQFDARFLSGGERQKLALARALISDPELVFLDEPTANLDGKSTREIETILHDISGSGTRLVMTSHDIGQAKRLATEVIFLNNGLVCEHRPAEQFFSNPKSSAAKAYLQGDIVE